MAETYTTRLRAVQQEYNSNPETWGTELNIGGLEILDDGWGTTEVTVSGNVTLTVANKVADQARGFTLILTGDGGFTVTTPAVDKPYYVINNCAADVSVKPVGGTTATVRAGTATYYYTNAAGTVGYVADMPLDKVKPPTANVSMAGYKLTNVGAGSASTDGASLANKVHDFAAPTAALDMNSQKITNLAKGVLATDAASLSNSVSELALATSALNMNNQRITGIATPTNNSDAATKAYVDGTAFSTSLPGQAGQAGKFVTTNGTSASWAEVYPSQTGNANKYLKTDGTNTSWADPLPSQTGKSGQYLTTDGTNSSWATITPAGQRNFTATGTLPNGATVVLNSDGTVSTVTGNPDTLGTAAVFRSVNTTYIASAALSATQVVVCYYDGTNAQAVIGTISGTSISFGAAVSFVNGIATTYISVAPLSSTSFVVAFTTGAPNHAQARVGSVSGATITFPTAATIFNGAQTAFISIAALSSTAVVIAYQDTSNGSYGTAIIGTISGTTISFPGSEYVFATNTTIAISVSNLTATSFSISCVRDTNTGSVYAASVSGTAITYGALANFDTPTSISYTSIIALTSTTFMVAWARSTTDGRAKIGTVSGTTVSFTGASDVVFNTGTTTWLSASKTSPTSVFITFNDGTNSNYGTISVGTITGTTLTFGTKIVFKSAPVGHIGCVGLTDRLFVGFNDSGNSNYGTGVVFQPAATNIADWIGITAAAIANGASGPVTILGGVNTSLSGLTTKATYYYANDGTLTTTVTSNKAGKALSATSLLITGNAQ